MAETAYSEFVRVLTPTTYTNSIGDPISATPDGHILHAVLGIASESGEIVDAIKKRFAYGKPLDLVNLDEEFGDLLWYIQLYCNARDLTLAQLIAMNKAKLSKRYKDAVFNQHDALHRDLGQERKTLEAASHEQKGEVG